MPNDPGKVLRRHRMWSPGLIATLTCKGGDQYEVTVDKTLEGLSMQLKSGSITAASNRIALKKMQRWLDLRYPTGDRSDRKAGGRDPSRSLPRTQSSDTKTSPRSQLESLFSCPPKDTTSSNDLRHTSDSLTVDHPAPSSPTSLTESKPRRMISLKRKP